MHFIAGLDSGGNRLPRWMVAAMESLFGLDFERVRIHEESSLPGMLGARAFACGSHIHFGPGEYNPETAEGWRVIGHELAHVAQQESGEVPVGSGQTVFFAGDVALEREAQLAGESAAAMFAEGKAPVSRVHVSSLVRSGATGVPLQCLMSLEDFNQSELNRTNQVQDVAEELRKFHELDGQPVRNYMRILVQLRKVFAAAQKISQPSSTVAKLKRQIALDETVIFFLADAERESNPILKMDLLEMAQEHTLVLRKKQGQDFTRSKNEAQDEIRKFQNWVRDNDYTQALFEHDVQKLKDLTSRHLIPHVLKDIILEATNATNVSKLRFAISFNAPMAGYIVGDELGRSYELQSTWEHSMGRKMRLGGLLHELTHVSIAEKFKHSEILLAIPRDAKDQEMLNLARKRSANISAVAKAIQSSAELDELDVEGFWRSEFEYKVAYPTSNKIQQYMGRYEKQLGTLYTRLHNLTTKKGMKSELVEYDTVINQMTLWCYLMGMSESAGLYKKLLALAAVSYRYRAQYSGGFGGQPVGKYFSRMFE